MEVHEWKGKTPDAAFAEVWNEMRNLGGEVSETTLKVLATHDEFRTPSTQVAATPADDRPSKRENIDKVNPTLSEKNGVDSKVAVRETNTFCPRRNGFGPTDRLETGQRRTHHNR